MARTGRTSNVVRVGRLAPPAFLPKPAPIEQPICEPAQLLKPSSMSDETMAVSTLLSWAAIAQQLGRTGLPLHTWVDNTFRFEKGIDFPRAILGSRSGPQPDADVCAHVIFEDLSSLILWAPWDTTTGRPGLFQPLPVAFRRLPPFHAFLDPKAIVKVVQGRLVHILDGKRRDLEDPTSPTATKAIHMGLVQSAQAWMKGRPTGLRMALDKDTGPDWGEDADGVWYVPPIVPHSLFDLQRIDALRTHLDHAALLLTHHHQAHLSRWHGEIRARTRGANGALGAAQIEVKALNAAATDYATKQAALIEAALLRALRLPSCPIPYSELVATGLYWPSLKNGSRRDRLVLTAKHLWSTQQSDPPNAHKRLAAIHALGGLDWI